MEGKKDIYYLHGLAVPETPAAGNAPEPWKETRVVGTRQPRVDGYERLSGSAIYPSDVVLPGMLYGAVLRCPHPHAEIEDIDTSAAEKIPGVRAVLTGRSPDAEVLWREDQDYQTLLFNRICRFEGEAVAAVAADTPYIASDALRAIRVEYKVLPFTVNERRALEPDAPKVHSHGNRASVTHYARGDVFKGLEQADVVHEESYRTQCEIHTPMELHGCAARWEGDSLTIWESTQGVYAVQEKAARALGMPLSRVRVIGHYMGGGFGSKLKPGKYTIIAALLARMTARPVKLFLTREETYLVTGNRPPVDMRLKAGVKKDGTLTALDFSCVGTGGAFPSGGTALVDWLIRDLYTCPNVRTESTDVFIHAGPARPFRAPGHPQGSWALEQMMDALAEKTGLDPVEIRLKNIPLYSQAREGNPPYTTTGLKECIVRGAREFDWKRARAQAEKTRNHTIRRGVGMACALWFVGGGRPPSTIVLKLFSDGSANLNMGASDIGTGTKTVMAMVVAEELRISPHMIQIENADTGTTQFATPSGGSKTVPTEAPAVRDAALQVKRQLLEMAAKDLEAPVSELKFDIDAIFSKTDSGKRIKLTDLTDLKKGGVVVGIGRRGPNPEHKVVNPFVAQFCEVQVNMKTGEVGILRFLSANESGRVMDRLTFDGQVAGGITMGIGLAMTEIRVLDERATGKMLNRNWHDYKLPTALDVPPVIVSAPVEMPDDEANTTGAKGLGEPVTIPTAGAVANAIHHATGIRMTESPMDPTRLLARLVQATKEG